MAERIAPVLAGVAVAWSALQFWPFADSKTWQLLYPANAMPLAWTAVLLACVALRRRWITVGVLLPHVSVLAFLAVCLLSTAFARDASRAVSYSTKVALMYVAGYALFRAALSTPQRVRVILWVAIVATAGCVGASFVMRYTASSEGFGFWGDPRRYGTYIATMASLGGAYLLSSAGWRKWVGGVLVVAAFGSSGTLGAVAGVGSGMILLAVVAREASTRYWSIGSLLAGLTLVILLSGRADDGFLDDVALAEADGVNLRQRYVEWQAEINLLGERAVTGAAAGCVNDYRSAYYERLPKLNTLAAFDQNGWLATAAETGVLGLIALCWMAGHYFAVAWKAAKKAERPDVQRPLVAGLVGLAAALAANVFSSFHYNSVLIGFVFVLALVSRTDPSLGDV